MAGPARKPRCRARRFRASAVRRRAPRTPRGARGSRAGAPLARSRPGAGPIPTFWFQGIFNLSDAGPPPVDGGW